MHTIMYTLKFLPSKYTIGFETFSGGANVESSVDFRLLSLTTDFDGTRRYRLYINDYKITTITLQYQ